MAKTKPETKKSKDGETSSADPLEAFRAAAMQIEPERVTVCRADVRVAFANVKQGVEAVFDAAEAPERKTRIKEIKEGLPTLSTKKALALPDLARALLT